MAAVLLYFNTLDYVQVFGQAQALTGTTISLIPGLEWSALSFICICLFIGRHGKIRPGSPARLVTGFHGGSDTPSPR